MDDKWFPSDSKAQARVDEYLEWQHLNTRSFVSRYFASILMPQMLGLKEPSEKFTKHCEKNLQKMLDDFERVFLKRGDFIAGDRISIADLIAAAELEQPSKFNIVEITYKILLLHAVTSNANILV